MKRLALPLIVVPLLACSGGVRPPEAPLPTSARTDPGAAPTAPDRYPLVPWPAVVGPLDGHFAIDERTRVALSDPADPELRRLAGMLAGWIRNATAVDLALLTQPAAEPMPRGIVLILEPDGLALAATDAGPGAMPRGAADATPRGAADATPRATADATPGPTANATPGATAGAPPGTVHADAARAGADTHTGGGPDVPAGPESYRLDVSPEGITLRATSHAGLFYGLQTLRQLLPPSVEAAPAARPVFRAVVPAVEIRDAPCFSYRGLHLDVGRHLFPVEFIKKYLDLMALYKLNRFHWHLTEDQGWRIEMQRYPRLTEVGAFRKETVIGHPRDQPQHFDGRTYGGYYTQDEVREIVRYAAERYITVIPEIELPGHSLAALAAYPELACTPGPFEVATTWGVFEDIYCPGEATFEFLENVLTEVMALFPGEYIHIGGDEAPKARWKESALAQQVIRREGLADEDELQSWFIRRIERFLNANGRKLIGWDEIVEGGLSPTATVMYWRNWIPDVPRRAAAQGNDLIMTPNDRLYLDHYQAQPADEPLAIGGLTTLEDLYGYDPVPADFTEEEARRILGAQGNVWTEYMATPAKVEYMVFPRALALAEVVWSPAAVREWAAFSRRVRAHLGRLDALLVNYRRP